MRLRSYPVPMWAKKLIKEICAEERIREPHVTWQKRTDRKQTSGVAWGSLIRLTVGTDKKDQKEALIHEMCHVILGQRGKGNANHSAEFYALLFAIGKRHRVGAAYIKSRENWYKPRGVKQGYALYLRRQRETLI